LALKFWHQSHIKYTIADGFRDSTTLSIYRWSLKLKFVCLLFSLYFQKQVKER